MLQCAVPFTLDYERSLADLGYNPPASIEHNYKWAGLKKPYLHQKETSAFLVRNKRAFCLNDMGTGKTLSTLWAADYLMSIGQVRKALIISPVSTLEAVWGDEIFKSFYHRRFNVLYGSKDKRLKLLKDDADFYIINPDGIGTIQEELYKRTDIDLVVIDELTYYKNRTSQRWKILNKLFTSNKYVWGLTGTPTPNTPTEAYGQAKLVNPGGCTLSYREFEARTMLQISQFRWVPRREAEQEVKKIMSPAIRFELRECIDLPETIYQYRKVELSPTQAKVIKQLQSTALSEVDDKIITAANAAVLINKIVQAACGIVYSADGLVKMDFEDRYRVLEESIEAAGNKAIIFVPYTNMISHLHSKLKEKWSCEMVYGDTPAGRRAEIFSAFQRGDLQLIVANPGTMSHGVTLTAASTIIWYAPVHSNEVTEQANARIVRPGQTEVTNIIRIYATQTEKKIYEALESKQRLQDLVLDIIKSA